MHDSKKEIWGLRNITQAKMHHKTMLQPLGCIWIGQRFPFRNDEQHLNI